MLAHAGLGSRREIEDWIRHGRVEVDGKVAVIGQQVGAQSRVLVDGRRIQLNATSPGSSRALLYHKPVGQICSRQDPQGRPTVFDALPKLRGQRWVSVSAGFRLGGWTLIPRALCSLPPTENWHTV